MCAARQRVSTSSGNKWVSPTNLAGGLCHQNLSCSIPRPANPSSECQYNAALISSQKSLQAKKWKCPDLPKQKRFSLCWITKAKAKENLLLKSLALCIFRKRGLLLWLACSLRKHMRKTIWGNAFAFPLQKREQEKIPRFWFVVIFMEMVVLSSKNCRNCVPWGWSSVADPVEWPKIGSLNRGFGSVLLIVLGNTAKHRVH